MPVTPLFVGQAFEPDAIESMSTTFTAVWSRLSLEGRHDHTIEKVARKIIELRQRGVIDAETLRKRTLAEFNITD